MSGKGWTLAIEGDGEGPIPLRLARPNGLVWHYTNASGLFGILESESLWATSVGVLNDTSELRYGAGVLREVWGDCDMGSLPKRAVEWIGSVVNDRIGEAVLPKVFVVSASKQGDLLNQWAHYGGDDGFAVGLRPSDAMRTLDASGRPNPPTGGLPVLEGWRSVVYAEKRQRENAREILNWCAEWYIGHRSGTESSTAGTGSLAGLVLNSVLSTFKHSAFEDEREVRYIAALRPNQAPSFRLAAGRIVPYVSIGRDTKTAGFREYGSMIAEVVLGPNVSAPTEAVIRDLLAARGLGDLPLRRSTVPFVAQRT